MTRPRDYAGPPAYLRPHRYGRTDPIRFEVGDSVSWLDQGMGTPIVVSTRYGVVVRKPGDDPDEVFYLVRDNADGNEWMLEGDELRHANPAAADRWIAWLPISGQEDLERKLRRPEVYATKAHAFPDDSALARCGVTLPTPGEDCLGLEYGEPRGRCLRCARRMAAALEEDELRHERRNPAPSPSRWSSSTRLNALGLHYMAQLFRDSPPDRHNFRRYMDYAEDQHFQGRFTDEMFDAVQAIMVEHFDPPFLHTDDYRNPAPNPRPTGPPGPGGLRPGSMFVVVDVSVPGGKWVGTRGLGLYDRVNLDDALREAAHLEKTRQGSLRRMAVPGRVRQPGGPEPGGRFQVIDAFWFEPARQLLSRRPPRRSHLAPLRAFQQYLTHGDRNPAPNPLRPGSMFVVVDIGVPGGLWAAGRRIYEGVDDADRAADRLREGGGRFQVIDALWFEPAREVLVQQGIAAPDRNPSDTADANCLAAIARHKAAAKAARKDRDHAEALRQTTLMVEARALLREMP